jgi:hypothetical protein
MEATSLSPTKPNPSLGRYVRIEGIASTARPLLQGVGTEYQITSSAFARAQLRPFPARSAEFREPPDYRQHRRNRQSLSVLSRFIL